MRNFSRTTLKITRGGPGNYGSQFTKDKKKNKDREHVAWTSLMSLSFISLDGRSTNNGGASVQLIKDGYHVHAKMTEINLQLDAGKTLPQGNPESTES